MMNLDSTFAALSHETRRAILKQLASSGETRLSDIAKPFNMSQTAVSKHVRVLSDAGLLTVERRGRTRHCRLNAEPMKQAADWLTDYETFWTGQFEKLARHLATKRKR
ncbi:MAG: helix-turn-helix transcriptional regulator [Rhizobiaceae bacterium]|nr:helix-turn-helix transcriptional regulator [Rhizobiaceae bacterium]